MAGDDPPQLMILKKHMVRIQEPRLRRTWEAALGLNNTSELDRHEAIPGKQLISGRVWHSREIGQLRPLRLC
jgi:hypothetical protein